MTVIFNSVHVDHVSTEFHKTSIKHSLAYVQYSFD